MQPFHIQRSPGNKPNAAPRAVLAFALASATQAIAAAGPPCDAIDFDNLNPGVIFTGSNQPYFISDGVTFAATCGQPFVVGSPAGAAPNPPSPFNALASPSGEPLVDCCLVVNFATPQSWVRVQVAAYLFAQNTPQSALTVTAYGSSGSLGSQNVVLTRLQGTFTPSPQLQWSTVLFDQGIGNCDITRIEICNQQSAPMFQFYIDDVEWGNDQTKPMVIIDQPAEKDCVCNGNLVVDGSVCEDACGDVETELRIRPIVAGQTSTSGSPPWVWLASLTPPLCVSIPGLFSVSLPAAQFPEGEYLLQMEGTNDCGMSETDERVILIDRNPPVVTITCPVNGQIVNKKLDIVGSVYDLCLKSWGAYFGPHPALGYPIIASGTSNISPVITSINTLAYSDGTHQLRVRAADKCNRGAWEIRTVVIDNTPPVAVITSPDPCLVKCQDDLTFVMGYVDDIHLAGWKLEFKMGTDPSLPPGVSPPWVTIATGTGSVGNASTGTPGLIAVWDQCGLPNCCYQLRLTAWDSAGSCPSATSGAVGPNVTIDEMCANLGLLGDVNGDGVLDSFELSYLLGNFGPCPSCP